MAPGSPSTGIERRSLYAGLLLCLALWGCEAPPPGYLYVTNVSSNDVSAYRIDAKTGELTPVPGSPFKAGTHPRGVAVTPSGRFAYVTNEGGSPDYMAPGSISGYDIKAATGALASLPGTPLPAEGRLYKTAVTPSGRFVYIATVAWLKQNNAVIGNSGISAYTVEKDYETERRRLWLWLLGSLVVATSLAVAIASALNRRSPSRANGGWAGGA